MSVIATAVQKNKRQGKKMKTQSLGVVQRQTYPSSHLKKVHTHIESIEYKLSLFKIKMGK